MIVRYKLCEGLQHHKPSYTQKRSHRCLIPVHTLLLPVSSAHIHFHTCHGQLHYSLTQLLLISAVLRAIPFPHSNTYTSHGIRSTRHDKRQDTRHKTQRQINTLHKRHTPTPLSAIMPTGLFCEALFLKTQIKEKKKNAIFLRPYPFPLPPPVFPYCKSSVRLSP